MQFNRIESMDGKFPFPPSDRSSVSFAVVIPMFNEEAGAEICVRRVYEELARIPQRNALIVVNDGSRDHTWDILQGIAPELDRLILVNHPRNQGYGAALKTGIQQARSRGFDYVLFMDSDLTNDPGDIHKFVARMEEGFEVIKASRYSHGGRVQGVPAYRYWISRLGNLLAHGLYGIPIWDCTNGFRAIKTEIVQAMNLQANNFSIIMEELYFAKFLAKSFCQVPVVLSNRAGHLRRTSFAYRPRIFYDYLKYPLRSFLKGNAGVKTRRISCRRRKR